MFFPSWEGHEQHFQPPDQEVCLNYFWWRMNCLNLFYQHCLLHRYLNLQLLQHPHLFLVVYKPCLLYSDEDQFALQVVQYLEVYVRVDNVLQRWQSKFDCITVQRLGYHYLAVCGISLKKNLLILLTSDTLTTVINFR